MFFLFVCLLLEFGHHVYFSLYKPNLDNIKVIPFLCCDVAPVLKGSSSH